MKSLQAFSPAKINLSLHLGPKRDDGYHSIGTLMQTLDFGDTITLTPKAEPVIQITCNDARVPKDHNNLVWQAIELFYQTWEQPMQGWRVQIEKNIPAGGGLGGASSNAVTVLKMLNHYHNSVFDSATLLKLAAQLGSDTAFFLAGGTAYCTGRGEHIAQQIESRLMTYLLIFPDFQAETARVYQNVSLNLTKKHPHPSVTASCLEQTPAEVVARVIHNDLYDALLCSYPEAKRILESIQQETPMPAHLSGSGSTFYFLCDNNNHAKQLSMHLQSIKLNLQYAIAHTYPQQTAFPLGQPVTEK